MSIKIEPPNFHIPESVKRYGVSGLAIYGYALIAATVHEQIGIASSPMFVGLAEASKSMDQSVIGHYFVGNIIRFINDAASGAVNLDPSNPELINSVNLLLLGIPLVTIGALGLGGLVKSLTKNEVRLFGKEPVKESAIPSHVIITSTTETLEGMVASGHASGRLKNSKKGEVVGIHLDQGIPLQSLKDNKIGHHFAVGAIEELIGIPGAEKNEIPQLVHESGLDRAREITINCVPENNSLFYGSENRSIFGPEIIKDILRQIKLKGKKINIILPKERKMEGKDTVAEELIKWHQRLSDKASFELNIITPEDEFIDLVRENTSRIALKKSPDESIHVLVLGQQKPDKIPRWLPLSIPTETEAEIQPLPEAMDFLMGCIDSASGRISAEGILISNYNLEANDVKLSEQIANGGLVILTAQSDRELISLTKKLVEAHGILRGKMIVIADREKTAEYLEKQFKVDTFVAARAINEAFSKND